MRNLFIFEVFRVWIYTRLSLSRPLLSIHRDRFTTRYLPLHFLRIWLIITRIQVSIIGRMPLLERNQTHSTVKSVRIRLIATVRGDAGHSARVSGLLGDEIHAR